MMRSLVAAVLTATMLGGPGAYASAGASSRSAGVVPAVDQAGSGKSDVWVDPMADGTPSQPRQSAEQSGVRSVTSSSRTASSNALRPHLTGYLLSDSRLQKVPVGLRPYDLPTVTPVQGFGTIDSRGVRVFTFPGTSQQWNHPVAQAQYALSNLNSYRLTRNRAYLDIATANAQRLIDRKTVSSDGWYYGYEFDFTHGTDAARTMRAPWYSAMAQGQALSTFVRLYQATGDRRWKEAADHTFISLAQAPSGRLPYASHVDAQRQLWLEEYPRYPVANSERVLNGHLFAMFGLHDYWQLTQSPEAERLARGALKTVEGTLMTQFRRPGGASVYSLAHREPTQAYHWIHGEQMGFVHRMTLNTWWLRSAVTFRGDFPKVKETGRVAVTPKVTTLYLTDKWGYILKQMPVRFSRATSAPFDNRQHGSNGSNLLRISAGPYAGWAVAEKPDYAWALGATEVHEYSPVPTLGFMATGRYTATALDASGTIAGTRTVTIRAGSSAPTTRSAWVGGRQAYYVPAGAFAGTWVWADGRTTIR